MSRGDLDRQMRAVLAQIETVSHVPAAAWAPTGRSRSSEEPPGGTKPPGDLGHVVFARRYGLPFHEPTSSYPGARTDIDRERVLHAAQKELAHIRGQLPRERPVGETIAQRDVRIVKEGVGFTTREVAIRFRCGERDVRKARQLAGREPTFGRMLEAEDSRPAEERRVRVRELRDKGWPMVLIAATLQVDKATVSRDLKGAA